MQEKSVKAKIDLKGKTVLVTGAAGFIGSFLSERLLSDFEDIRVIGFDSVNDYYDIRLKESRLEKLQKHRNFIFIKANLADKDKVSEVFREYSPQIVVNLAAQAGVRYSITNPDAYIESNIIGFYNILEACRHSYDDGATPVEHLVYASSSSVYGSNKKVPYSTDDKVDNPVSLYAATKKSDELMAHAFRSSIISPLRDSASSRSTDPQAARTWRISASPTSFCAARRYAFSTTATASATSHISTI